MKFMIFYEFLEIGNLPYRHVRAFPSKSSEVGVQMSRKCDSDAIKEKDGEREISFYFFLPYVTRVRCKIHPLGIY